MISKQDYLQALSTVEAYHRQLGLLTNQQSHTPVFAKLLKDQSMSHRLGNALRRGLENFDSLTLLDLSQFSLGELRRLHSFGTQYEQELRVILQGVSLELAE
jgi:hypothetical protein